MFSVVCGSDRQYFLIQSIVMILTYNCKNFRGIGPPATHPLRSLILQAAARDRENSQ